jgi:hypothetical protein
MGKKLIKLLGIILLFLVNLSSCYEDKIIDMDLLDGKDEFSISNDSDIEYVLFIVETDSTQTRGSTWTTPKIIGVKNVATGNTLIKPDVVVPNTTVTTEKQVTQSVVNKPENVGKQSEKTIETQSIPSTDLSKGDQLLITLQQKIFDPLGRIQEQLNEIPIVYDGETIVRIPFVIESYIEITEFKTDKLQKILENDVYFKTKSNKYLAFKLKDPVSFGDEDWKYLNSISNLTTIEFGNILNDKIPDRAFKGNKTLRTVIFGTNTKEVGYESFAECENLIYLTLSNKIAYIGSRAFYNDTKLIGDKKGNLEIPKSVNFIGDEAFENCGFLCDLKILGVIDEVGIASFKNTKFRTGLSAIQNIRVIKNSAFENSTFEDDLIIGGKNNMQISELAFANIKAKSITIKNNITFNVASDSYVFYSPDCTKINIGQLDSDEIMLSENLNKVFQKGTLQMIIVEINFFGLFDETPNFGPYTTIGDLHLYRDLNLPDKGGTIQPDHLLNNKLTIYIHDNVKINGSLKNIAAYKNPNGSEYQTFWEKSIYFGNNVEFNEGSLKTIDFFKIENLPYVNRYSKNFLSKNSGIRENVQVVINYNKDSNFNSSMFEDNGITNSITIKHGLVNYPIFKHKKFRQLIITEPITTTEMLGSDPFSNTYYKTIALPYKIENGKRVATVKKLGKKAFAHNPNLEIIYGLENVETLGSYLLYETPKITGLLLHNVKDIDEFAFAKSKVKILDLSNSPLNGKLKPYALARMDSLRTVSLIDSKISKIPMYCFADDHCLRDVIIGEIEEKEGSPLVIYNQVTNLKTIGSHAFDGCYILEFNVPNSVETIDEYAFANCRDLKINMFEGLKTIGPWCFWNCEGLVYVNIPKSITSIGEGAFKTRSESKELMVKFNWIKKDDIIPYDDDVWLFGQLIIRVPKDGEGERVRTMSGGMNRELNLINTNKYFDKGYGKISKKNKRTDKKELQNWGKDFNIPKITQKTKGLDYGKVMQGGAPMAPMAGFDIITNIVSGNLGGGSYTVSTYIPATITLQPTIHEDAILLANSIAAEALATYQTAGISAIQAVGALNYAINHSAYVAFSGVTGSVVYATGVPAASTTIAYNTTMGAFGGATAVVNQTLAVAGELGGSAAAGAASSGAGSAAGAGAVAGAGLSTLAIGAITVVAIVIALVITAVITCWLTGVFNPYVEYTNGYYATENADIYLPSGDIIIGNDDESKTLKLSNKDFASIVTDFKEHQKDSDERVANEPATRNSRNYKQNLYPNVPPPIDYDPNKD